MTKIISQINTQIQKSKFIIILLIFYLPFNTLLTPTSFAATKAIATTAISKRNASSNASTSVSTTALLSTHSAIPAHSTPTLISLDFPEIKTRDLIQLISKESGKNVIISEKVIGNTTIHLKNVTFNNALDLILRMHGLSKHEENNFIYIAPINDLISHEQLQRSETPDISAISLHNANAEAVAEIISKTTGVLTATEGVVADKRTNTLIMQTSQNKNLAIRDFVRKIDLPLKQILILAEIVSADENFVRELGVKFGTIKTSSSQKKEEVHTDLPFNTFDSGRFNLTIAKLSDSSWLTLELAALENEGRGKIISSPKLLTTDRKSAIIESGAEIPYQEKAAKGGTSVAFKKAALSLEVTPEIVANNAINLHLSLNQDKVGQIMVNGVPTIDTHKIQTQVVVKNGQTIVLGGIYEWFTTNRTNSVPILGKIPIFGALFRHTEKIADRKELLIIVTPKIVE